jgi:chemotaxis signal transduction protein
MRALLLHVGASVYGLPLAAVGRLLGAAALHLPPSPVAGLHGWLDWQGQAVPVLDLAALAGGPAHPLQRTTRLVLLQGPAGEPPPLALLADPEGEIAALPPDTLLQAAGPAASQHLGSAVLHGGRLVQWLQPASLCARVASWGVGHVG